MQFPINILYTRKNFNMCIDDKQSLYFMKDILIKELKLNYSLKFMTKLYQLIDLVGFEKSYNLIINCNKLHGNDISDVQFVVAAEPVISSSLYWSINRTNIFKIVYGWSKQYEHVIDEEKTDNSSMEQKLLDTTLQKIEIFAGIIQSYENKFDRQSAEITALKEHLTKQDTEITALKTKLDTIIQLLTTH